jgi:hypothetical protein
MIWKKIVTGMLVVGWVTSGYAQDAQTMLEQIAALRTYLTTAEKGYQLVENGLHTIRDLKKKEYGLHSTYFSSLSTVNPVIQNMPEAAEVIRTQRAVLDRYAGALVRWRGSPWLSPAEKGLLDQSNRNLITTGGEVAKRLQNLLTDSVYKMSDGERMHSIGVLAEEVKQQAGEVERSIQATDWLISQRQKEYGEGELFKKWLGIF